MPKNTTAPKYGLGPESKPATALHDLALPDGGVFQVRRPGLQKLIAEGLVDNLDTLTAIVATKTIPTAEGEAPQTAPASLSAKQITEAVSVMDRVTCAVVVQPKILPVPEFDEDRDGDALYVDDVPLEVKTFVMQYALGGTSDLETFRRQSPALVGGVPVGT